jgi:hypothetical protein
MIPGCKSPVQRVGERNIPYDPYDDALWASSGPTFAWTGNAEYGDDTVVKWMAQRKLLLHEFSLKLVAWRVEYRRQLGCGKRVEEMEITEHGVSSGEYRHYGPEIYL